MNNYSLSTHLFVYYKLNKKIITNIAKAGFNNIEIWGTRQHLPYCDIQQIKDIIKIIQDNNLSVTSFHSPFYTKLKNKKPADIFSISSPEQSDRELAINEMLYFMETIQLLFDFKKKTPIVLHCGFNKNENIEKQRDKLKISLIKLLKNIDRNKVILALENGTSGYDSPLDVKTIIKDINDQNLKMCLDIGHANITTNLIEIIPEVLDYTANFHIHDNNGEKDQHLLPKKGNINFKLFFSLINNRNNLLTLELMDYNKGENFKDLLKITNKAFKLTKEYE